MTQDLHLKHTNALVKEILMTIAPGKFKVWGGLPPDAADEDPDDQEEEQDWDGSFQPTWSWDGSQFLRWRRGKMPAE